MSQIKINKDNYFEEISINNVKTKMRLNFSHN